MFLLKNAVLNKINAPGVNLQDIIIETKRNHLLYEYDREIWCGNIKEMDNNFGRIIRMKQFDNPERKDYFLLLEVKSKGYFVSNYVYYGKVTSKAIEQYKREIGEPVFATKEEIYLWDVADMLKEHFSNSEINRVITIDDTMRIKLSDARTKKKYTEFVGERKQKPYIKPDFKVVNNEGQVYFVEVERTKHKEQDFLRKLMKLKMTGKRVYFLFNGEDNFEYHAELIAIFERQTKSKFKRLYYATVEAFKFNGMYAFQRHC